MPDRVDGVGACNAETMIPRTEERNQQGSNGCAHEQQDIKICLVSKIIQPQLNKQNRDRHGDHGGRHDQEEDLFE